MEASVVCSGCVWRGPPNRPIVTPPQTPAGENQQELDQPALDQDDQRNPESTSRPLNNEQTEHSPPVITVTDADPIDNTTQSTSPSPAFLPGRSSYEGSDCQPHAHNYSAAVQPDGTSLNNSGVPRATVTATSTTQVASPTFPLEVETTEPSVSLQEADVAFPSQPSVDMYHRLEQDLAELASRSQSVEVDVPVEASMQQEATLSSINPYNDTSWPNSPENTQLPYYQTVGDANFDPYIDGTRAANHEEYYRFLYETWRSKPGVSSLLKWMQESAGFRDRGVYQHVRQHCLGVFVSSSYNDQPLECHEVDPYNSGEVWRHRHLFNDVDDNNGIRSRIFVLDDASLGAIELIGRATHLDPRVLCIHLARTLSSVESAANVEQIPLIHRCREWFSESFALPLDPRDGSADPWSHDSLSSTNRHVWTFDAPAETLSVISKIDVEALNKDSLRQDDVQSSVFRRTYMKPWYDTKEDVDDNRWSFRNKDGKETRTEFACHATMTIVPESAIPTMIVLRSPTQWHPSHHPDKKISLYQSSSLYGIDPLTGRSPMYLGDALALQNRFPFVFHALQACKKAELNNNIDLDADTLFAAVSVSTLHITTQSFHAVVARDYSDVVSLFNKVRYRKARIVERTENLFAFFSPRCARHRLSATARCQQLRTIRAVVSHAHPALHLLSKLDTIANLVTEATTLIDATIAHLDAQKDSYFQGLQIELTNIQIAESRYALDRNESVRRITLLAFIFIPISAVTGFFGMNVAELADTAIWKFGATMGAVLGATLVLAYADSLHALWTTMRWKTLRAARLEHRYGFVGFFVLRPLWPVLWVIRASWGWVREKVRPVRRWVRLGKKLNREENTNVGPWNYGFRLAPELFDKRNWQESRKWKPDYWEEYRKNMP